MTIMPKGVGVDVSKAHLDVSVEGRKPSRFKNSPEGVASLASSLPPGSVVILERSGGNERLAVRALMAAGHEVRALHALSVKRFGQSIGQKAKTDLLDAKTLALATVLRPGLTKSEEREALADHSRHVQRVKRDLAKVRKRLELPWYADCTFRFKAIIFPLESDQVSGPKRSRFFEFGLAFP